MLGKPDTGGQVLWSFPSYRLRLWSDSHEHRHALSLEYVSTCFWRAWWCWALLQILFFLICWHSLCRLFTFWIRQVLTKSLPAAYQAYDVSHANPSQDPCLLQGMCVATLYACIANHLCTRSQFLYTDKELFLLLRWRHLRKSSLNEQKSRVLTLSHRSLSWPGDSYNWISCTLNWCEWCSNYM